jgi:hypothetical protein
MVLLSVELLLVGAVWFALWFSYVLFAIRTFPRVRTTS